MAEWQIVALGFETPGDPTILPGGLPSGEPKPVEIEKLLDALLELADVAARKLNAMEYAPSEFTLEGHVALQVSAGLPGGVLQFGVETGIGVSMTWSFEKQEVVIMPRHGRKTDPSPPESPVRP
jgi:hypothetical protein